MVPKLMCHPLLTNQIRGQKLIIFPDVLHSDAGKPRTLGAAAEDAIQALGDDLSPSAASGHRDLHPQPLHSSPRDGT